MIVMFIGGGPAGGMYRNIDTRKTEVRVATPEMVKEGKAAFYIVSGKEPVPGLRATAAVASFSGVRDCAASLLDWVTEFPETD